MRRPLVGMLGWRVSERRPSTRLSEGEAVAATVIERPGFRVQKFTQKGDRLV